MAKKTSHKGQARAPQPQSAGGYGRRQLTPQELQLDPENPRLAPAERGKSQTRLLEIMLERFAIDEIAESICSAGFLPMDPFIGCNEGGKTYILEGNRRLATIKLLLEPSLGGWPFVLSGDRLEFNEGQYTRSDFAAYTTLLLIEAACSSWYQVIAIPKSHPIRTAFEHIAAASIANLLSGKVLRFGAPYPDNWPTEFEGRVGAMAEAFGVRHDPASIATYATSRQQDDSLDIVARIRLVEEGPGYPYVLVQCATGATWANSKIAEPNVPLWKRYVSWDGPVIKALAIPFMLHPPSQLGTISGRHGDALIFDRMRLAAGKPDTTIAPELRRELVQWCNDQFTAIKMGTKPTVVVTKKAVTAKNKPPRATAGAKA